MRPSFGGVHHCSTAPTLALQVLHRFRSHMSSNICRCVNQDIMRLDNSARMNLPGKAGGNWAWRIGGPEVWERLSPEADALRQLADTYGRLAPKVRVGTQSSSVS